MDRNIFERTIEYLAAMHYYSEVTVNDFVDAFNSSEKDKIKVPHASLKAQIILSYKFVNASKSYKNDDSL